MPNLPPWVAHFLVTLLCFAFFCAGFTLAAFLTSARWGDRCHRCQSVDGRIHTTPGAPDA